MFFHQTVKDNGAVVVQHLQDGIVQIIGVGTNDALGPESLCQLYKVGQGFRPALGITLAMQQFLPLSYHTQTFIVQDELFDRQAVLHRGAHFLHVHQPRRFARDVNHQRVGVGHLHTDGGRKAVAHRAKPTGCHPAVRVFEIQVLCRPHLVLAHFGRDIAVVILGQRLKPRERVLRFDDLACLFKLQAVNIAPFLDLFPPFGNRVGVGLAAAGFPDFQQVFQHMAHVTDDRNVDTDDLVDRRWVDVDVRFLRLRAEQIDNAGDTVVKTRADVDHQIAVVHRHIGLVKTVHPQHSQPFVARRRIAAKPHQCRGDGKACRLDQFAQQLRGRGARVDDAAASIKDRAFGRFDGFYQCGDLGHVAFDGRLIMRGRRFLGGVLPRGELHILGDVDKNWTGASAGGHVECLVQDGAQFVGLFHQPIVFGAGAGDAHGVGLLKGVRADHKGRHLPRQNHKRNGIEQGVRQTSHSVGGTGARGHKHNARFPSRARIAFGGMNRALFVAHQHVFDAVLLEHLVINR